MYDFNTGRHSCASFSPWVRIALKRWQEGCEYRLATGVQAPGDTGLRGLCLRKLDLCHNCCANISSFKKKPKTTKKNPKPKQKKQQQNQYGKKKKKKPPKLKQMKIRTAGERRVCRDSVTEEAKQLYGTVTTC